MATLYRVKKENELVVSNDTVEVQPKNGTDFSLEELQDFVGGYIEIVQLNDDRFMVVNEEGKLQDLPLNVGATLVYGEGTGINDVIVGNALVCKTSEIK